MHTTGRHWLTGWPLTGLIGGALTTMVAALFLISPDATDGTRLVIRSTARTSLALFLLVFVASSLWQRTPSPLTDWLRRNRRFIGVAFAISHVLHLAAIIVLAQRDPVQFHHLTNIVTYVGGGLAYVFILLMTLTSFDRTASWIGSRIWRGLHLVGVWYIWLSFTLNFGKRVPGYPGYLVPVLLLVLAAAFRLATRRLSLAANSIAR